METHGSTPIETLADADRLYCCNCWAVTRRGRFAERETQAEEGRLCQVTPGAPISVQQRGDGTERLRLHARVRMLVAGVRVRVVIAQEVVRAGGRTGKQAMQMCRRAGVCACQVLARPSEGHELP